MAMAQETLATPNDNNLAASNQRALKILSRSLYKELRSNGYDPKQVVSVASELLGLVTSDIREEATVS